MSSLSVSVPAYNRISTPSPIPFVSTDSATVFYVVQVKAGGSSWLINKRYSDFLNLRKALGDFVPSRLLPKFPEKLSMAPSWMRSQDIAGIEQRRKQLESWLIAVISLDFLLDTDEVRMFLELNTRKDQEDELIRVPEAVNMRMMFSLKDPRFGVNAFNYDLENDVVFAACAEMSVLGRANAWVSNRRFPWDKKVDIQAVSVGGVNVWRFDHNAVAWSVTCSLDFPTQATAICWCAEARKLVVGFDDGTIRIYTPNENYTALHFVHETVLHKDRISGLIIDVEKDLLFSASRDGSVACFRLESLTLVDCLSVSLENTPLACLEYDASGDRLFVGDILGALYIVKVRAAELLKVHRFAAHTDVVRSLHYSEKNSSLLSGSFDQKVRVHLIPSPGKEAISTRLTASFNNGPPSFVKYVKLSSMQLLVTGHQTGVIAMWSIKDGRVRKVIRAHNSAITHVEWIEGGSEHVLVTGSKDGDVKFWKVKPVA